MLIRKATSADIPFIKECLIDSWVMHTKNTPDLLDEDRMRQSKIEEYYLNALKSEISFIFIGEVENKFAGFVKADIQEIAPFFKHNRIMYIDDIYIKPAFRHHGYARELLNKVEETAKENGIKRLQARIYTFNTATQKLFLSLGFSSPHATWDKIIAE